jgi:hypothetical protein
MKNEGGRKADKCLKVVPDCGDRCLFIFFWSRRLFCNVFLYPVCKAQLIGDWYENRRGARNTIILLIICQYYWRTNAPCANSNGGPNMKKNYWQTVPSQHCLLAEGDIGAPIYWHTDAPRTIAIGAPIHPAPLVLAHWKRNILHVNNAGCVEAYILHVSKRRTEQFGAPRLFSYQSPINWALQTGNRNRLQKRRRQH